MRDRLETMRESHLRRSDGPAIAAAVSLRTPLRSGVYELRLYFADSLRQPDVDVKEDGQNRRHFQINLNGHPLIWTSIQLRTPVPQRSTYVFSRIVTRGRWKVHLESFRVGGRRVRECAGLTPGTPGRLKTDRAFRPSSGFVDADGTHWSGEQLLHRWAHLCS